MVDFPINTGLRKIGATAPSRSRTANQNWFDQAITIKLSSSSFLATIVVDFAYTASGVIEYTLDNNGTWIKLNNGQTITGGQSRFIDVTTEVQINFRSTTAGTLTRCIVSSVP